MNCRSFPGPENLTRCLLEWTLHPDIFPNAERSEPLSGFKPSHRLCSTAAILRHVQIYSKIYTIEELIPLAGISISPSYRNGDYLGFDPPPYQERTKAGPKWSHIALS